jgi:hypothetical protein
LPVEAPAGAMPTHIDPFHRAHLAGKTGAGGDLAGLIQRPPIVPVTARSG